MVAMCAKTLRFSSHSFHVLAFFDMPIMVIRTGLLCHITASCSGTSPSILLLNVFTTAPQRPVISVFGIRVPDMSSSCCALVERRVAHKSPAADEM